MVTVEVRLYATLRQQGPAEAVRGVFAAELPEGSRVEDLLGRIGIDPADVHMIMVNGIGQETDAFLKNGDRVGLFPPVGGG